MSMTIWTAHVVLVCDVGRVRSAFAPFLQSAHTTAMDYIAPLFHRELSAIEMRSVFMSGFNSSTARYYFSAISLSEPASDEPTLYCDMEPNWCALLRNSP